MNVVRIAKMGFLLFPLLAFAGSEARAPMPHRFQAAVEAFMWDVIKNPVPGVAVAISTATHAEPWLLAKGVRHAIEGQPLDVEDRFNIGSCTKSFTAVLIARLVAQERLAWGTTLGEWGERVGVRVHPGYRDVTIDQVLLHRAGIPKSKLTPREFLVFAPDETLGFDHYSDNGYALLGLIAETLDSSRSRRWDELIQDEIFAPLGIRNWAFQPGTVPGNEQVLPWELLAASQPVPHHRKRPEYGFQNDFESPAVAPAAAIHLSVAEWHKFVRFLQAGASGRLGGNAIVSDAAAFHHLFELGPPDASGDEPFRYFGNHFARGSELMNWGENGGFTSLYAFDRDPEGDGLAVTIATHSHYARSPESLDRLHSALNSAWRDVGSR